MNIKLMHVKCNLCGSNEYSNMFQAGNSSVVKCKNCGFAFLNPAPTEKELKRFYNNLTGFKIEPLDKSPIEYDKSLERLKVIENLLEKGRILDVGSGGSNFLSIAKSRGWDTYSTDIRKEVLKLLKRQGIKTIDERKVPDKFFSAITLAQVLEHISDPMKKLKFFNRILRDGGVIVIEVPNIESLGARFFRDKWYFIKNPEHLSYFSSKTLKNFLEKAGFCVIKTDFLGATLVTDFTARGKIKKEQIFNIYRYFKLPINLFLQIFNKLGLGDTLRIVAQKPSKTNAIK